MFKKYSQMKLQMKREALRKLHRQASESGLVLVQAGSSGGVLVQSCLQFEAKSGLKAEFRMDVRLEHALESIQHFMSGRSAAW